MLQLKFYITQSAAQLTPYVGVLFYIVCLRQ